MVVQTFRVLFSTTQSVDNREINELNQYIKGCGAGNTP